MGRHVVRGHIQIPTIPWPHHCSEGRKEANSRLAPLTANRRDQDIDERPPALLLDGNDKPRQADGVRLSGVHRLPAFAAPRARNPNDGIPAI